MATTRSKLLALLAVLALLAAACGGEADDADGTADGDEATGEEADPPEEPEPETEPEDPGDAEDGDAEEDAEEPDDGADADEGGSVTLRVADVQAGSPYTDGLENLAERVEEQTDGRVRIDVFGGTQLGGELELVTQVRGGTLDMAQVGVSGFEPLQLLWMPYLFRDDRMMEFTESDIAQSWGDQMLEEWGVRLVDYIYFGPRFMTSNSPIETPDDLAGVRIRVPELPVLVQGFQAWNASVVPMNFAELYTALQTGAMDAQENPLNVIYDASFYEVQDFVSLTYHAQSPRVLLMNEDSWQSLSSGDQEILANAYAEVAAEVEEVLRADDEEYLQLLIDEGMEVTEPDIQAFVDAVQDVGVQEAEDVWGPGVLDEIRENYGYGS